jgi:hypothetical protein
MAGDEATPIVEILPRTKIQSLDIRFISTSSMRNGGTRFATALERCTCITELRLEFTARNDQIMEFFPILFLDSIPKMLRLKKSSLKYFVSTIRDSLTWWDGVSEGIREELKN